jgi:hypothetical protein
MPVDGNKAIKVLVVHGVQLGDNKDLDQDKDIKQLIDSRLNGIAVDFDVDIYRYENINDNKIKPLLRLSKLLLKTPAANVLVDKGMDLVLDVVINLQDGSAAEAIRAGLKYLLIMMRVIPVSWWRTALVLFIALM